MNNDNKTYELSKEVTHTTNNEESLALLKIQNKKINELYCTLDEKEADLKKIQLNCKSLEKKYQQSQSAFMQTEKKLKETLNQLNIQSLSQKKLYQDFSDIQNVCQENTNKLSQYEKNIMELSKEVENINSINKMLKDKNNVLSKERIGLTERIETLTESERNLKAKVKELLSAISEKDSQIGQLKNLNAKYVIEKKNSDNECASLIKKHNKLSAQLLDKETERDRLVSEYKKLNQKYNDNINKNKCLNEQNYKLQVDYDNLLKVQNDFEKKYKGYQSKIVQLTSALEQKDNSIYTNNNQLANFITKFSKEFSTVLNITEEYLSKQKTINQLQFLSSNKLKEMFLPVIEYTPCLSSLLDNYEHLITLSIQFAKQNNNQCITIKNLSNKISFLEQISLDSNQKIMSLEDQNNQQNQKNLLLSEKHNEDLNILSQNIDQLNSELKAMNKIILHSYKELYTKYAELSSVMYNCSIRLKEQKLKTEESFSNPRDFIFGIESIAKDLINYILLLSEENKTIVKLREENDYIKKEKIELEHQIYQLNLTIERNNSMFKKTKENIVNDFEKQMFLDVKNAKETAMSEIKILNKALMEKDEELNKIKNDYKLLYTQYRLIQKEHDEDASNNTGTSSICLH